MSQHFPHWRVCYRERLLDCEKRSVLWRPSGEAVRGSPEKTEPAAGLGRAYQERGYRKSRWSGKKDVKRCPDPFGCAQGRLWLDKERFRMTAHPRTACLSAALSKRPSTIWIISLSTTRLREIASSSGMETILLARSAAMHPNSPRCTMSMAPRP